MVVILGMCCMSNCIYVVYLNPSMAHIAVIILNKPLKQKSPLSETLLHNPDHCRHFVHVVTCSNGLLVDFNFYCN